MPKFKCSNENCNKYNEVILIVKTTFIYDKTQGIMISKETCSLCKQRLTSIQEELDLSSIQLSKIGSMTMEQKKDVLRKRSRDLSIPENKQLLERKKAIDNGVIKV